MNFTPFPPATPPLRTPLVIHRLNDGLKQTATTRQWGKYKQSLLRQIQYNHFSNGI